MNVLDAAHRIGLEYPGGITGLAPRMNIDPAVLRSKLNPNCDTHHLTLKQAVLMQVLTGRTDILYAMAEELGFAVIPLPMVSCETIPQAMAKTCGEFGDFMRGADSAVEDGKVTPNEVKKLEKELTEMVAAASNLHSLIVGKK
jgi:hypothetical protein